MQSSEWGPVGWKFLHACTFGQSERISPEQQARVRQFFGALGYMLPCPVCQDHYNAYLAEHPVRAETQDALSRWLVDLHNDVNIRTHNPFVQNMEYRDVEKVYRYKQPQRKSDMLGCDKATVNAKAIVLSVAGVILVAVVVGVACLTVLSCRQGRCPMVQP